MSSFINNNYYCTCDCYYTCSSLGQVTGDIIGICIIEGAAGIIECGVRTIEGTAGIMEGALGTIEGMK